MLLKGASISVRVLRIDEREIGAGLAEANQLLRLGGDGAFEDFEIVFLCLDSLKGLRSPAKSIFDKSITGRPGMRLDL